MRQFTAIAADEGLRADVFVAKKFPKFSRSALSRLFDSHSVTVNGRVARAGYRVRAKDSLRVNDVALNSSPRPISLPTIYEDDDVVVVDKPAGVLVHSKGAVNDEATVASSLRTKISPELTGNRAGIIHRLDRATSGVMVVAKNEKTLKYIQRQFSNRKVKKTYRAVVEGSPEPTEAIIDAPIARNPKKPQTFMVRPDGKPSQTHYKVREIAKHGDKTFSSLELIPATGRTHQLRVHLAYIGHPIAGDSVYGRAGQLMLHAQSLKLRLPSGEIKTFSSPLPERFSEYAKNA